MSFFYELFENIFSFAVKILKAVGSFVLLALAVGAVIMGFFVYELNFKPNTVDKSISPDGSYTLTFQEIGEPLLPFASSRGRLLLKKGIRRITSYKMTIPNDGSQLTSDNWNVSWCDDYVEVMISGENMQKQYVMNFDGTIKEIDTDNIKNDKQ